MASAGGGFGGATLRKERLAATRGRLPRRRWWSMGATAAGLLPPGSDGGNGQRWEQTVGAAGSHDADAWPA
ncbi:hypothetical protein [Oryza sativa Japonica Group]|uniref:Uncharacterized protein n=1 Tax=Oryza sativa subsp. japonica TaxID=39947 RepID=Q5JKJ7_ORYSJ|nr:hypothetical protein [Oryza sativa Japonica Group]